MRYSVFERNADSGLRMSLPILVLVVALGIAAIVLAVHYSGGGKRVTFANADEAAERFAIDHPERPAGKVWLTTDGHTAFLDLGAGGLGVVHSVGLKALTRILAPGDVAEVELKQEGRLKMRFRDFTWRGGEFTFDDVETARAVLDAVPLEKAQGRRP